MALFGVPVVKKRTHEEADNARSQNEAFECRDKQCGKERFHTRIEHIHACKEHKEEARESAELRSPRIQPTRSMF